MAQCSNCGLKFSEAAFHARTSELGADCPNCGHKLQLGAPPWETGGSIIRGYFSDLWQIITQPTRFFRRMPVTGGMSYPLAFALVTHWLGAAGGYLWGLMIGGAVGRYANYFMKVAGDVAEVDSPGRHVQLTAVKDQLVHWIWGAGAIITDPFRTLFTILFISFLIYIAARILVSPGKNGAPSSITFESALRIVCFGMSPAILGAIPLFGTAAAAFLTWIITVIGTRETYRISSGRAVVIGLFPQLLFFGLILFVIAMFFIIGIKIFASMF